MFLVAGMGLAHGAQIPDGLLGDWGGLRTYLADHGVDLELSYINESAANVRGGDSREAAYADQFYFGGWLNLERLIGVSGARIVFSLTDRHGESLSVKAGLNNLTNSIGNSACSMTACCSSSDASRAHSISCRSVVTSRTSHSAQPCHRTT